MEYAFRMNSLATVEYEAPTVKACMCVKSAGTRKQRFHSVLVVVVSDFWFSRCSMADIQRDHVSLERWICDGREKMSLQLHWNLADGEIVRFQRKIRWLRLCVRSCILPPDIVIWLRKWPGRSFAEWTGFSIHLFYCGCMSMCLTWLYARVAFPQARTIIWRVSRLFVWLPFLFIVCRSAWITNFLFYAKFRDGKKSQKHNPNENAARFIGIVRSSCQWKWAENNIADSANGFIWCGPVEWPRKIKKSVNRDTVNGNERGRDWENERNESFFFALLSCMTQSNGRK